jgi:hypothetical protein
MNYFLKLGILGGFSLGVMYVYYAVFPHGESREGYYAFLTLFLLMQSLYVAGNYFLTSNLWVSRISVKSVSLLFLAELLAVSIYFFVLSGENMLLGLVLFFKILFFILCISLLWGIFWAAGKRCLNLPYFPQIQDTTLQNTASVGLGFFLFQLGCFGLAALGYFTLWPAVIYIMLLGLWGGSYILALIQNIWSFELQSYETSHKTSRNFFDVYTPARLIDEMLYAVMAFLVSVNLVSVYRPYPIGWDDLGAYMNVPKMISSSGELLALWKMYAWELYTSLWFLFGSQSYAFFLNSFSGILSAILLVVFVRMMLSGKKSWAFDLSLLAPVVLLMMPMSVFQLAKDMKLDFWLLAISLMALILFFGVLRIWDRGERTSEKYLLFALIGIFIWVAFSVKVTSLLLLLGVLGTLSFAAYGLVWFFSFCASFIGVFTWGNMWYMMNVVIPGNGDTLLWGGIFLIWGILWLVYASYKAKTKAFFLEAWILLVSFFLALSPWVMKHISEVSVAESPMSIGTLVSGASQRFLPDYSLIYDTERLEEKKSQALLTRGLSESGTTVNADFWRYFGYEQGINNYLKLPYNLSFQVNQAGEFTDISFVFFALIPLIFLFLPYRYIWAEYLLLGVCLALYFYLFPGTISWFLSNIFALVDLPFWYLFLAGFYMLPLVFFVYTLDTKNPLTQSFLYLYSFSVMYVGLWGISAFGIVWYGIVMYAIFLACIILILAQEEHKKYSFWLPFFVASVLAVYLLQSALPHGISNLRQASFTAYKLGHTTEDEAIFLSHPDYFPILFALNIHPDVQQNMFVQYRNKFLQVIDTHAELVPLRDLYADTNNMRDLHDLTQQALRAKLGEAKHVFDMILQDMYHMVLFPPAEIKNSEKIFRAGTFLKYYISENHKRLLEDDLLFNFENYLAWENPESTVQNISKLWMKYILVDLNAATIDQDPKKELTQRYEKMLQTFTSDSLELVETDSVCLKLALDQYANDSDIDKFMRLAGVNYGDNRQEKKYECISTMLEKMTTSQIDAESYSYLIPYAQYLENNKNDTLSAEERGQYYTGLLRQVMQNGYKALFVIK